ncbi:MAG: hypothetical protein HY922_13745, partial [Elusimicrobia bacterium]|nr:hypothetical protein [Elusimicrobiota bacterium]
MNRMIVPLMIPLVSGFAQALWAGSPAASKGQISQIQPKAQLVARAPLRRPSVLQQRLAAPPAALAQEKVQTPPAKNIRRLQVEGLLTDSKYKPLQGVYLLYFRFLDAQPGSRELWQSS